MGRSLFRSAGFAALLAHSCLFASCKKRAEHCEHLDDLACPVTVVVGLGASGTLSLNEFFRRNGFAGVQYRSPQGVLLEDMISKDIDEDNEMLTGLCKVAQGAARAQKWKPRGGKVALSDLKIGEHVAQGFKATLDVLEMLDETFTGLSIVWNFRHPTKWASSCSHWKPQAVRTEPMRRQYLSSRTKAWLDFNCACYYRYKDRIGYDTTTLNLEVLDWDAFKAGYREASGCSVKGDLPRSNHHPAAWTFPLADADNELKNMDAMTYFRQRCAGYKKSYDGWNDRRLLRIENASAQAAGTRPPSLSSTLAHGISEAGGKPSSSPFGDAGAHAGHAERLLPVRSLVASLCAVLAFVAAFSGWRLLPAKFSSTLSPGDDSPQARETVVVPL